jgi:RecA/RadA recombinase
MFILDSLGNLSTTKEMEDSVAGSDTKDMTRAQVLKAAFRVLSLKLSVAKIPMIFTNHVYDKIGQGPYAGKEQGGGCLVTGTQVVMGDMTLRNIEDVMVGEYVLTLNGSKEVLSCWDETNLDDPEPECYRLTFDDGSIVECSDNHRFMVDGNWVEAKDVKVGDYFDVFRG